MKKKTLIILGVILIVLIGVGFYFFSNQSTYKVIINNKTNKEISGLQISYSNNSNIYNWICKFIYNNKTCYSG